jgi:hypothetical protein
MERFGHREHLELAWTCLRRGEGRQVLPYLRHLTEQHGDAKKLNVTVTRFWVDATAHALGLTGAATFADLLAAHPQLLDKDLPLRHWRPQTLWSEEARGDWVDPDLQPLPF